MHRLVAHSLILLLAAISPTPVTATGTDADLDCVILPDEQVELSSPVPGVIEAVLVRRSDRVTRGQVLARLESSVEQATVALADAREQTSAEAGLRRVEFDFDAQHRNRLQSLHTRQAVSAQIRDDAERVAAVARLRLRLAEDRRREAMLERQRADAVLALKTLKSPIDGVIVEQLRTVGEYVEDRPVLRIARLDPLRVEVIAPLALFGLVHRGMQIAVRPETDPGHERVATVTAVDAVADPGSGTFGVQLELANPDLMLPAGIKCKGRLVSRMAGDAARPEPPGTELTPGPAAKAVEDERLAASAASSSAVAPTSGTATDARSAAKAGPNVSGQDGSPEDWARPPDLDTLNGGAFADARRAVHASGACLTYDALDDEATARALLRAAQDRGARVSLHEVTAKAVFGYVVALATTSTSEAHRALEAQLRAVGISDFATVARGDYAGRISLGVYNGPLSAQRRRAALAALGFESEVLPRTRNQRAWRVTIQLAPGPARASVRADLSATAGVEAVQSDTCEPLLATVR